MDGKGLAANAVASSRTKAARRPRSAIALIRSASASRRFSSGMSLNRGLAWLTAKRVNSHRAIYPAASEVANPAKV